MMIRYLLLVSMLTLSACQSNQLAELDYQPGRDYQGLTTWQWAEPAVQFVPDAAEQKNDLDSQRLRQAISQQMLQQGFTESKNAPLQVRAWLITDRQQQRTEVLQSDYWGPMWGPSLRAETYEITIDLQKLQIDILDSSNQQLIWRGSDSWVLPQQRISPEARTRKLQQQVEHILHYFPPN
ncbi:DUF4136 domain-containing protein [Denitrificimonas caeni]|uniref:DUF4136 domain-containing protein n=1 Tax=Denitrificimonas caeni TaxID=521720 RepID=UPI001964EF8A|nr:DUF4136 domain-containing protein [Denitrificimonas caeni]